MSEHMAAARSPTLLATHKQEGSAQIFAQRLEVAVARGAVLAVQFQYMVFARQMRRQTQILSGRPQDLDNAIAAPTKEDKDVTAKRILLKCCLDFDLQVETSAYVLYVSGNPDAGRPIMGVAAATQCAGLPNPSSCLYAPARGPSKFR